MKKKWGQLLIGAEVEERPCDIPRDWYQHARSHYPAAMRKEVRLRLDPDLLAWFKRQGPGYQARINAALRAFVEAHERNRTS